MKNIIGFSIAGFILLVLLVVGIMVISLQNEEVGLRTAIEQKQRDNTSEFDNMWKKISQVAQVTEAQKNALKDILVSHAQARSAQDSSQMLMKWLQESVPNVDTSVFNNLQNIIVASRDAWTFRQKELLDLKREHDALLRRPISGMVLSSWLGKKLIDVTIVTSTTTEKVFAAGKDDNTKVF